MAVDIQKLFNEEVPEKIAKNPAGAKAIGGKYQFVISGDGGGEWFFDLTAPKAEAGNPGGADVTIKIAAADFPKLMENPQANGMQLYFAGKLKFEGNQMLAMKLNKLFEL
ncbi:SCP2 sterol-binding domain-containing protein [Polyangium mundeleinium]|uniref:SCP2 sterol-binding domain-containing protein n=1 Tax=Polyangium mundeleinium TaxID=2995306 RepID=A0ABT5F0G6_9BACT|nr:SCP2 sterol-binding domain-containing protein [Polyangium mundeleinium]MDC0747022.1 SCP2 sterol-binding domain-containing protein [Polyangium mundeleinium]